MSVNKKSILNPIPPEEAIPLWNQLANTNPTNLTHAHNPSLFTFYSQYLHDHIFYLFLYAQNQVIGLLPLTHHNKQLFSMPHLSYGGIHWLNEPHPDDESTLNKVSLILNQTTPPAGFYRLNLEDTHQINQHLPTITPQIQLRSTIPVLKHAQQNKAVYWMSLKSDPQQQMATFAPNLRRKIKSSLRKGIEVTHGGIELLNDFMPLYRKNLHRLGSPALGKDFFQHLLQTCPPEEATIAIAYHHGQPIGGGLWLSYHGFCENTHFATLPQHNHLYTTYALHWTLIKHAISNHHHTYSFGRSTTDSTVAHYKTQWPVQILPLYHNSTHPIKNTLASLAWLTKIWKHLPALIVNTIGPSIAKRIY